LYDVSAGLAFRETTIVLGKSHSARVVDGRAHVTTLTSINNDALLSFLDRDHYGGAGEEEYVEAARELAEYLLPAYAEQLLGELQLAGVDPGSIMAELKSLLPSKSWREGVEAPSTTFLETTGMGHTEGRAAQRSTAARRMGWSRISGACCSNGDAWHRLGCRALSIA